MTNSLDSADAGTGPAATNPLATLESKVDRLIALCDKLGEENRALKTANSALAKKIDTTAARLEALLKRLPDDE